MQRPQYFANEGQQIVGTLHLPNGVGPHPGVLLCHGFTGMRLEAHFLFVKMSRSLERAGMASLRFDFRGSGESGGEFRDMTVETEVSDALKAVDVFCQVPEVDGGRIGVLGLSLGGFVAACVTGFEKRVKSTVLWSAVASLPETIGRRLDAEQRLLLDEQGYLDIGGHALGKGFLDRVQALDPLELIAKSSQPLLIVHGSADESVPPEHADRYQAAARHGDRRVEKFVIEGADHTYATLADEQTVVERTAAWFKETL